MKKIYLIKRPDLFQGYDYLIKRKNYFEGYYFKNVSDDFCISFIPGISINNKEKKAFIQIITNDNSYYINYSIDDFYYNNNPFYIKIGNNSFSCDNVHIDIINDDIKIMGDINYSNSKNIKISLFSPNIMGIFSYIPFMECNHAIISMNNKINGIININDEIIKCDKGIGYIEKDFGISFPKSYIWCQGNNFKNKGASFMLSIADIPFFLFNFRGIICSLIIDDKEYRFATYNGTRLLKCNIENNFVNITLKKRNYFLEITANYDSNFNLIAPIKGEMKKNILESVSAIITIKLRKNNKIIFSDTSYNCGLEIVK